MSHQRRGAFAPMIETCRYGASRLACRGPAQDPDQPYIAALGGCETFGRFVRTPFPALLQDQLDDPVLNLGTANAGIDSFLRDPDLMAVAQRAALCLVQVMPCPNLSNGYYRVHPRRNDRFTAPTAMLRALYPEIDWAEVNFTGELLHRLRGVSGDRFRGVAREVRATWVMRMRQLMDQLACPVVLLWLRHDPGTGADAALPVTREMIDAVAPMAARVVDLPVTPAHKARETAEMLVGLQDLPVAGYLIGPQTHRDIAAHLTPVLASCIATPRSASA